MKRPAIYRQSYTIIIIFILLVITGIAVVPLLSLKLNPTRSLPSLSISFSWPGMPPAVIEQEVTSLLESVISTTGNVGSVSSRTSTGRGTINLEVAEGTDLRMKRFEIATLLRETWPKLPQGVTFPVISYRMPDAEKEISIQSWEINGNASPAFIREYADEKIAPVIAQIEGVTGISVTGAGRMQFEINYDEEKLRIHGISRSELEQAVYNYFYTRDLGRGLEISNEGGSRPVFISIAGSDDERGEWQNIPVAFTGGKTVWLNEVAKVSYAEQDPFSYYRINGLNTINMVIMAEKEANQIKLARLINKQMTELSRLLPGGFSVRKKSDTTEYLAGELRKIFIRTIISLLLLLAFVFIISRELRYLLVIAVSLIANIIIAFIFYWLFSLELHLYSLAGITVSFGIIIDNTIVMADHLRHKGNMKVFVAVLAATLTTIGALSVIFFLDPVTRNNLLDFASVVIVSLAVSLGVALFLIPSMLQEIGTGNHPVRSRTKWRRRVVTISSFYGRALSFLARQRKWVFIVAILGFGFPVWMIPDKLPVGKDDWRNRTGEEQSWFVKGYNRVTESTTYRRKVKPVLEKGFGGSLRLFRDGTRNSGYYWSGSGEEQRTRLTVYIRQAQDGLTLDHINDVCMGLENVVAAYDEVELFITTIRTSESATVEILFKQEEERGIFPWRMKFIVEDYMNSVGSYDVTVAGVGRAFSNMTGQDYIQISNTVNLSGYNLEELLSYAGILSDNLLKYPRVRDIFILGGNEFSWQVKKRFRNNMEFDRYYLAVMNTDPVPLFGQIREMSLREHLLAPVWAEGKFAPVAIRAAGAENGDNYSLKMKPLTTGEGSFVRAGDFSNVITEITNDLISRVDQEYVVTVSFNFLGTWELAKMVTEDEVRSVKAILPLGYKVSENRLYRTSVELRNNYLLVLLIILIVFMICAVLLESYLQAAAVISVIPFSFIGLFLTFGLFNIRADEGVFAAMILLSGLSVNSALYIVNDFNNCRTYGRGGYILRNWLKAHNSKIIPILLTVLSTVIGLLPFLLAGKDERFWYALATGTIGGLIFSMVGIWLYLPLFIRGIRQEALTRPENNKRRKLW